MTRDEALDLLALHGADELDPAQAAAVEAALADDPALREELAVYRELEGYLGDALADDEPTTELPAWLRAGLQTESTMPASPPEAAPRPIQRLIQRRCPYCHDQLETDVVLCSVCGTPHHGGCFADHEGCSMLGCESTRAVDMDNPDARRVCPSCQGLSPSEAPFCAWCATPLGDERGRRERRLAQRMPLRQYLSAAALLLATTLGMGAYFGSQQEELAQTLLTAAQGFERARTIEFAREMLNELHDSQEAYARGDLDHDGANDWATDLESLRAALAELSNSEYERLGLPGMSVWGMWPLAGPYRYAVEATKRGPRLVARTDEVGYPQLICDRSGRIRQEW